MAATGLYDDGKKGIARPTDPVRRAKDMDRDGVQAEVIYGILGAATRLNDHEAATEMFHIYPNVRIGFGESGIGWVPYALDRMDFEWEDRFRDLGSQAMRPSDYWRRQCKATFQFDRIGTKLIDDMGVETSCGGRTTRTATACGRNPRKYIAEQFGHLPARRDAEDRRARTRGTSTA